MQIKNFCKSYGDNVVYDNFNLDIEEGKITCILGESGCGKTTLLNAVAYLTEFNGSIPKLKCSYVFQSPRLVPSLTVFGNLRLVCGDELKIKNMLERVGLSDKADSYPVELSGGQAQRVSLARAFLYGSEIILMDEPFSSLDLKIKAEIIRLFYDVWSEDKRTVLFVTHDIDEAVGLSNRTVVLGKGKIIFDGCPSGEPPRKIDGNEDFRRKLIDVLT